MVRNWISLASLALTSASPWYKNSTTNQWLSSTTEQWVVGANFVPSTAVNELQMFQLETYDVETIKRELSYAQSLGFNSMRVFLHNLLWEDNSQEFLETLESFLQISSSYEIKIIFVLLDSCWNASPSLGPQPDPIPYVHNSQWVQAPGTEIIHDQERFMLLKDYVVGVISHFQNDKRVIAW
jgi:endo-1,4-beta-mannosidase